MCVCRKLSYTGPFLCADSIFVLTVFMTSEWLSPCSRCTHLDMQMLDSEEEERLSDEALQASANAREEVDLLRSDLTKCRQDLSQAIKRTAQAEDKLKEVEETLQRWKQSHSDAAAEAKIYM